MSAVSDLRTYLLTQSGVTDLVGTRIYYDALQQSTSMPAVVLELTGSTCPSRHLGATGTLYRATVTMYAYADSRAGASALGDALYNAVEFDAGTWDSTTIQRALVEHRHDLADELRDGSHGWRYIQALFGIIWHE